MKFKLGPSAKGVKQDGGGETSLLPQNMAEKRRNQLFLSFMAPLPPPRAIYIVRPKCQSPSRIHQPALMEE